MPDKLPPRASVEEDTCVSYEEEDTCLINFLRARACERYVRCPVCSCPFLRERESARASERERERARARERERDREREREQERERERARARDV